MATEIRPFEAGDEATISTIICRCLREVNALDYPPDVMENVVRFFTPEKIARYPRSREIYVAESGGLIVGTASLARDNRTAEEEYVCLTVFVLPELQGAGVGKALMARVEEAAREKGANDLQVPSSFTALPFYTKLGYTEVSIPNPNPDEPFVWMAKPLRA